MTTLINVFPHFSTLDTRDRGCSNAELFGDFELIEVAILKQYPDSPDISLSQFSNGITFSERTRPFRVSLAPFLDHVVNIIGLRSKKEMVWTDTSSVIAMMQYVDTIRNFTMSENPCHSMRTPRLTTEIELSVAEREQTPCPQPACSRLFHLTPESLFRILPSIRFKAWAGTELPVSSCESRWTNVKVRTAMVTGRIGAHRMVLSSGAMLPDGRTSRGLSHASILPYTSQKQVVTR